MKLKEIMQLLEEFCPRSFAMSWDNAGLQVGYADKEVNTIALAVDATSEVISEAAAQGADPDSGTAGTHTAEDGGAAPPDTGKTALYGAQGGGRPRKR